MSEGKNDTLKRLFSEARTFSAWLPDEVTDETIHSLYEVLKFAPTSANCSPARFMFVKKGEAKEKLIACLDKGNVEKVKAAPVTAIIAQDDRFYERLTHLFPHAPALGEVFAKNKDLAQTTCFRNSSLQGAYLILAARAMGLDCGPMSGFDNKKLDETFFQGTSWRSNFLCNLGHGDRAKLFPRLPRLTFDETCQIL